MQHIVLYLIQKGSCAVRLERDGVLTHVAYCRSGQLVGEMSVLTDDKQTTYVDAQSDMVLWRIKNGYFRSMDSEIWTMTDGGRNFLAKTCLI